MSEALTRIFALQQQEINRKEQLRQRLLAKSAREIQAFQASPVYQTFMELKDIPIVTPGVRAGSTLKDITLNYINATTGQQPRLQLCLNNPSVTWWCEESPDSNVMQYCVSAYPYESKRDPNGIFLESFIKFVAPILDHRVVEQKLRTSHQSEQREKEPTRRKIQTV